MTRLRPRLLGLAAAATAAAAAMMATAPTGWADAPSAYGWWYEANAGLPVPSPAPPSVPPDGLYVANGVSGPAAIAALTVPVPPGAAMGPLVLHVAGSPLMTQPPVACPLRSSFKPAEGGAWADRPTYDCMHAMKIGSVDSAKTTVSFDASPFLRDGVVAVAILAGGPTDQVAFAKPGPGTLATSNVAGADPGAAIPRPASADATSQAGGAAGVLTPPTVDTSLAASPLAVPAPAFGSVPPSVSAGSKGATLATGSATRELGARSASHSGWRSRVGGVLGVAAVLLALLAWNEGYGLLGGRVRSLASPLGPSGSVEGPTRRIIRRPRRHRSA